MTYKFASPAAADFESTDQQALLMTLGERIKQARNERGLKQRNLAEHFEISVAAVGQWETDVTLPESTRLIDLAKLLGVRTEWLLNESGPMRESSGNAFAESPSGFKRDTPAEIHIQGMPRDLPVLGIASCGPNGQFAFESGNAIDFVRRPPRLSGIANAYALYVQGSSMSPWREEGQTVYVHPSQPVQVGDYVVVQVRDDEHPNAAYIKKLVKKGPPAVKLLQFNPRDELTIPTRAVVAVHRIIDWSELLGF